MNKATSEDEEASPGKSILPQKLKVWRVGTIADAESVWVKKWRLSMSTPLCSNLTTWYQFWKKYCIINPIWFFGAHFLGVSWPDKKEKKLPTTLKSYSGHSKMTNLLWRSAISTTRTTSFAKQDSTKFLFSVWCWHAEIVCEQLAKLQIQSSLKWNLPQNQLIFINRQHGEQSQ